TSGNVVQVDAVTAKIKVPVYKPPKRGAPAARVGGGTRGVDGVLPDVYVLAPDHVGLTTHEQPTLSWYMSKPTAIHFEFSLIDENGIEPLLELTLEAGNLKAGIQGLDLAKYGIKLKPEVQYQWSVALVPDSKKRSSDVIASGMIERRGVDNSIAERLSKADAQEDVFIYAEKGYWYDAVSELSVLIDKNPGNKVLRQQRAELLKQAGLPDGLGK
ncbi:MAG: DUF928 domain-containing protein, partial [Gammaproteobacteria bacterium]|nr:DUF928 domain-containing protein [Gammaproteobacteria bacterium]